MTHTANGKSKYLTRPAILFHDLDIFSNFLPRTSCLFEIAENTSVVKIYLHRPRSFLYYLRS